MRECRVCGEETVIGSRARAAEMAPRDGWTWCVPIGILYFHDDGRVCDRELARVERVA